MRSQRLFDGSRFLRMVLVLAACPAAALAVELRGAVVDEKTGRPVAARVYIRARDGGWHFVSSTSPDGSAVRYEKQNWINKDAVEMHTTVSADPFLADLPPGTYAFTVERGKEYFPLVREVTIQKDALAIRLPIRRWVEMAGRGWFSGETHLHRTVDELRNIVLAEDLNVSFPLSFWVTKAFAAPSGGDRNMAGEFPARLVSIDPTHVIWPRNTEYEIFTVGQKQHTLGALFVLNHRIAFAEGVPPWGPVARKAVDEGALLDLDKLDWAFSMTLPAITSGALYEVINNHIWRTEFAFRQWVSSAAPYLQPCNGGQTGSEREWVHYTLGMYYTLLDSGFRMPPTAGTASGVHPVPAGFGRVYVHLPDEFSYEKWLAGLRAGRSFVTTGPMLLATADQRMPGEVFRKEGSPVKLAVAGSVISEQPLAFIEVIRDGLPVLTFMPTNQRTTEGACVSRFAGEVAFEGSGWMAVRCWEDRPGNRFRFAHTAPWYVEIAGRPVRPRSEQRAYLVQRMKDEMARSKAIVPLEANAEYERALSAYERLQVHDDSADVGREARPPRDAAELDYWLRNMVYGHRFTHDEIRRSTGLSLDAIAEAMKRLNISESTRPQPSKEAGIRVLPYPGGRHPRSGFLEGAMHPQRDTKVSVFTPWDPAGYVVIDVPEAIFSNLGLLYLAHTHVPTMWDKQGVVLPPVEWSRRQDGTLDFERRLPNGIRFGTKVTPGRDAVQMELWLQNGTDKPLTGLQVQNCVMLKAAAGFSAQTNQNKLLSGPYAGVSSEDGLRWIITAWSNLDRTWANAPVPCMHSDPKFPDCQPGETRRLHGRLWFYEGRDIQSELKRIEATGWRSGKGPGTD
ncbi:MAG: CehA/McbA family metallohydrolase [Planctomycetota bacterium]|nr:CehA/McbA family metallohydrolase [Planctomycetota bacterium]